VGKVLDAIRTRWLVINAGAYYADVMAYVETGDRGALARIKPEQDQFVYWGQVVQGAIAPFDAMADEDRRGLHALAASGRFDALAAYMGPPISREKPGDDTIGRLAAEVSAAGLPGSDVARSVAAHLDDLATGGQPNSAGRLLLGLSDADLERLAVEIGHSRQLTRLADFLLDFAPDRMPNLVEGLLKAATTHPTLVDLSTLLLDRSGDRYEKPVAAAFRAAKEYPFSFSVGEALDRLNPGRYRAEVLEAARRWMSDPERAGAIFHVAAWLLRADGEAALPDVIAFLDRESKGPWKHARDVLNHAVRELGDRAIPAALKALENENVLMRVEALSHLIALDKAGEHLDRVLRELEGGLQSEPADVLVKFIDLAARSRVDRVQEGLWPLLGHKSKPVREGSARALARMGEAAVPKASGLLADRKADVRGSAVAILAAVGPAGIPPLEDRLDKEASDDVRDAILLTLDAHRAASGRVVTDEEIEARIARSAAKLKGPPADWIDEAKLPPIRLRDGPALRPEAVRYLLHRQSRVKESRADIEARPLLDRLDRATSGEFALDVLRRFAASPGASEDRWAMTLAGLIGDDRSVPVLAGLAQKWGEGSRGKMAEYAVEALALLGTDAALTTVDALALRFRTRSKNVGQAAVEAFAAAADRAGVSVDEMGDRVVPRLGFEPGKPRVIDCGGRRIEAAIGLDFKLRFRDLDKGKPVASLPKSAPSEALDEFKGMAATLREVVKAQLLRLENLMVRQHRWPVARWLELFPTHPLLIPFAARLVWGVYDNSGKLNKTFRALEDRTLTGPADDPVGLPETGAVGMVHPLELDESTVRAWQAHLADYEVAPPFPQLDRPAIRVGESDRGRKIWTALDGATVNAMTFRGRADRLGWTRGSVVDAGMVSTYRKSFAQAGVEAFLSIDGLSMGGDMTAEVTLGDACFVRAGSVAVGSYTYDNPSDESDARLIPFGEVPPVVYSEVLGELGRIAGRNPGGDSGPDGD